MLRRFLDSWIRNDRAYILVTLTVAFFSTVSLHTMELRYVYASLMLLIVLSAPVFLYAKGLLRKTIISIPALWILANYSVFLFNGIFRLRAATFNTDFFIFNVAVLLSVSGLLLSIDQRKDKTDTVCLSAVFGSLLTCAYMVITQYSEIVSGDFRVGDNLSGNVNSVAVCLGIGSFSAIYLLLNRKKVVYAASAAIIIFFMLITGSKNSLIVLCVIAIYFLIYETKGRKKRIFILSATLVVGFILVFKNSYLYNIIGYRIVDFLGQLGLPIRGASYSNSTALRIHYYEEGFKAFLSKPLFGGGMKYFEAFSGAGTYSHSNYIEVLANFGVVGFLLYYAPILYTGVGLVRKRHEDYSMLATSCMIFLILLLDFSMITYSALSVYYYPYVLGLSVHWQNDRASSAK